MSHNVPVGLLTILVGSVRTSHVVSEEISNEEIVEFPEFEYESGFFANETEDDVSDYESYEYVDTLDISDLARFSVEQRDEGPIAFTNCGTTNRQAGFLSSDHPYKPGTACRWLIKGPPGAKIWVKVLKMDIEEERPSDSAHCGSPFKGRVLQVLP